MDNPAEAMLSLRSVAKKLWGSEGNDALDVKEEDGDAMLAKQSVAKLVNERMLDEEQEEPTLDRYFTKSKACDYPWGVNGTYNCPGHYSSRRRQCLCPCFKGKTGTDGDGSHRRRCGVNRNGGPCGSGTFNDGTTDECQSCSGTVNVYQTSCYVADDATEEEDLGTAGGEWVMGANGETCDNVCENKNQVCDETELSTHHRWPTDRSFQGSWVHMQIFRGQPVLCR